MTADVFKTAAILECASRGSGSTLVVSIVTRDRDSMVGGYTGNCRK
jgi:hypothetical protein